MREEGAVFLSASVPKPERRGSERFDPVLIGSAVHAFVEVVLGRRLIVWGGHPAITPMIWEASKRLGASYKDSVRLYQSAFFRENYPEANVRFPNWIEVPEVTGSLEQSLVRLREQMFSGHRFHAAVFIGGMEGVIDEYTMLRNAQPTASLIPIPAPGGVAAELYEHSEDLPREMEARTDFTYWLYRLLDIDPSEPRELNGG